MPKGRAAYFFILSFLFLAGCFGMREVRLGDQYMDEQNWDGAVFAYQEAIKKDPTNLDVRNKLDQAKTKAAAIHLLKGRQLLKEEKLPQAMEELKHALILDPTNPENQTALNQALRRQQARDHVAYALRLINNGKFSDASDELAKALAIVPGSPPAQEAMAMLSEKRRTTKNEDDELALKSTQPITLKFQNAKLKDVFELLSKTTGINILFDKDVRDDFVSIFIKDASFKEVLNLILATNNLFMKKISDDTILIVPKLAQKLNQYQDLMIQTFYLSNIKAKDMINLLRTMLETKRIFVNDELNAIVIRDTPDKMKLAEKIIDANDRNPSEVMFEVEILEIDKNKSSQVGWNLNPASATIALTPNPLTLTQLKALGESSYLFTLPSIVVDFMKQESDAKTLANPKIRVVDNKVAKVTIGDKFPILLSTSTFSPTGVTTGGTVQQAGTSLSTSVEYKDTGIKLTVEPNIHLNNNVTVKLNLTVTTLGNQVDLGNGTKQYEFGERNAESVLEIRDGETVVIGGLIGDQERNSVTKVPGLGDIPMVGKLFSNVGKSKVTTDLVMTITPRIVRLLETPDKEAQGFWSGTEETYSIKPLFSEPTSPAEMKLPAGPSPVPQPQLEFKPQMPLPPQPQPQPQVQPQPQPPPPPPPQPQAQPQPQPPPQPQAQPQPQPKPQSRPAAPTTIPPAVLTLQPSGTTTTLNQEVTLAAEIQNAKDLTDAVISLSYDPKVLEFKQAVEGPFMGSGGQPTAFVTAANPENGLINLQIRRVTNNGRTDGSGVLFGLSFADKASGSSPILLQSSQFLNPTREPLSVSFVSGHVNVK